MPAKETLPTPTLSVIRHKSTQPPWHLQERNVDDCVWNCTLSVSIALSPPTPHYSCFSELGSRIRIHRHHPPTTIYKYSVLVTCAITDTHTYCTYCTYMHADVLAHTDIHMCMHMCSRTCTHKRAWHTHKHSQWVERKLDRKTALRLSPGLRQAHTKCALLA